LKLPANEPGSSILPGKVNPTQCEAMVMVCIQVIGDDSAVAFAGSQGNFELKLQTYCIDAVQLGNDQIAQYVHRSLMLVTALSPVVGYDKATAIGNDADRTLRESALDSGAITAEDFDRIVNPTTLVGPF
jgi:fumarate hydratase class II